MIEQRSTDRTHQLGQHHQVEQSVGQEKDLASQLEYTTRHRRLNIRFAGIASALLTKNRSLR